MNIFEAIKAYKQLDKIKEAFAMKDWKTTISSVVVVIGFLFKIVFKADIPQEVSDAIIVAGTFFIGFFAGDSKKTG